MDGTEVARYRALQDRNKYAMPESAAIPPEKK